MKKFGFQIILLLAVIASALYFYKAQSVPSVPFLPQPAVIKLLTINNAKLKVEIADTKEKRSKGLGEREKIASDEGMLFVFDKSDKYAFWMKGMKFALDLVWIRGDMVVDVTKDAKPPLPGQADESLPKYSSSETIDKVLEVNKGVSDNLNIKVGDKISIE